MGRSVERIGETGTARFSRVSTAPPPRRRRWALGLGKIGKPLQFSQFRDTGIQVIEKTPLQFSIYHSQAIMYISHKHGPTCQVKYFYMFPYCPWAHLDKGRESALSSPVGTTREAEETPPPRCSRARPPAAAGAAAAHVAAILRRRLPAPGYVLFRSHPRPTCAWSSPPPQRTPPLPRGEARSTGGDGGAVMASSASCAASGRTGAAPMAHGSGR